MAAPFAWSSGPNYSFMVSLKSIYSCFIISILAFVGCQEEVEYVYKSALLPNETYPVVIAAEDISYESRMTRVSQDVKTSSISWTSGDIIAVTLEDGYEGIGLYSVSHNGKLCSQVSPLFWRYQNSDLKAWYPAYLQTTTVSLNRQNDSLVYLMKAFVPNASYLDSLTSLRFEQKLAQIGVCIDGDDLLNRVKNLSVLGYSSCEFTKGNVTISDKGMEYLPTFHTIDHRLGINTFTVNVAPVKDFSEEMKSRFFRLELSNPDTVLFVPYQFFSSSTIDAGVRYVCTLTSDCFVYDTPADTVFVEIPGSIVSMKNNAPTVIYLKDGMKCTFEDIYLPNGQVLCEGDAKIYLQGHNCIYCKEGPVINAPNGMLELNGSVSDSLDVKSSNGSGISGKDILVRGGVFTTKGENGGAGIDGRRILIEGGSVSSSGGNWGGGAGIGCSVGNKCYSISIFGGSVHAVGGIEGGGAGIGSASGSNSSCDSIFIHSGQIRAEGGDGGAGIGSGLKSICTDIEINGGDVCAMGYVGASGIGTGAGSRSLRNGHYDYTRSYCNSIVISGGSITAKSDELSASIGSGIYGSIGEIFLSDCSLYLQLPIHSSSWLGSGYCGLFETFNLSVQKNVSIEYLNYSYE